MLDKQKSKNVIYNFDEFLQKPHNISSTIPKRALVSYLVSPLLPAQAQRDTTTFSNAGLAQYIPRALNELGYSVDIVNYDNKQFFPEKKYDLFLGHAGINFEQIEKKLEPSCIRIYYSTGVYWKEWNNVENERLIALQKRKGVLLPKDRWIKCDEEYANTHADGIICLGNLHARETYHKFPLVLNVNNAVYPDNYSTATKDFKKGRNNFLFFNGSGNVHKGLDLLLDAFTQLDQHLYVRQEIEPAFLKLYKTELTEFPNIHLVSHLKKPSKEFFDIMNTCNFIISPTCAEGQPGAIIECMAHGLIPILSKEANIDTKDFGLTLNGNSVDEIIKIVKETSQKPDTWYNQMSMRTLQEIHNNYTPEKFLNNMKNAITVIVNETKRDANADRN